MTVLRHCNVLSGSVRETERAMAHRRKERTVSLARHPKTELRRSCPIKSRKIQRKEGKDMTKMKESGIG